MKDKLLALIYALNPSEVRYFKQFASRTQQQGDKNYIHLFDEIVSLKKNDESSLVQKLQEKGIKTDFLAADKNYLYHQILRSLQAYHAESSVNSRVANYLIQIDILYHKSLYDTAYKLLLKAKKLAQSYYLVEQLLVLLQWERKISGMTLEEDEVLTLFKEIDQQIALLHNLNDFNRLYYRIMLLRKKLFNLRNNDELTKLQEIMQHPLLHSIEQAKSIFAKIRYYEIYANYYYLTHETVAEFNANHSIIQMYNQDHIEEHTTDYVAHYSRYLRLLATVKPENFKESLAHFKGIPKLVRKISPRLAAQVAILAAGIAINNAIKYHHFEEAVCLLEEEQSILEQHSHYISDEQKTIAYYRFTYICLIEGNYSSAIDHANYIINHFNENVSPEIRFYARLIQLIIHYETNNFQILPYIIRTARESFEKRKTLQYSEKIILNFMIKLAHQYPNFDWRVLLIPLREKLMQSFELNYFNRVVLKYFDIIAWIDSKSANISFKEALLQTSIYRQNNKEQ